MSSNLMQFLYMIGYVLCGLAYMFTDNEFLLKISSLIAFTFSYTLFNFVESRYFDMSAYHERDLKIFKIFNLIAVISISIFVLLITFNSEMAIYDAIFPYVAGINLLMFAYFFIRTVGKIPQKIQKTA